MSKDYVWYACYGSNICYERFLCYIDGQERIINGIKFDARKSCANHNPPIDSRPYQFKHNMYFANKSSQWGNQGVAFIDLNNSGQAHGRIYKITKEQFSHVRDQESRSNDWYGYPKEDFSCSIDEVEGIKVFTFTQLYKADNNPPSAAYKSIIKKGLIEIGLSDNEAEEYIELCIKRS